MRTKFKFIYALMALAVAVGLVGIQPIQPVEAGTQALRISQAYGGGGNSGATYTHDFIELFNSTSQAINLDGWTVQYAAAAGTSWSTTELVGSIPANGYYLIQEAQGSGGTEPLPPADATGNITMSATNFKVALVNSTTALTGSCPQDASIIDFVGAGTANCYEGTSAAPAGTNTTSISRTSAGCQDTDQNDADFTAGAPTPRNSASPTHSCGPVEEPMELFFSEYIEGTSSNKALEIYNGNATAVDLTDYAIHYYNNAGGTMTLSLALTGSIAAGDVYVITADGAAQVLLDAADLILAYPSVVHFNGDDTIGLFKVSTDAYVDVIGQFSPDPGNYWGTDPITTQDHTLVRKNTICAGDPDGTDAFDPATEWNGFPIDTFDYIGSHTAN
jgi:predicted extracellular nuclease